MRTYLSCIVPALNLYAFAHTPWSLQFLRPWWSLLHRFVYSLSVLHDLRTVYTYVRTYAYTYIRTYVWSLCLSACAAKSGYGSQTQRLGKDSLRVSVGVYVFFYCCFVVLYSWMARMHETYVHMHPGAKFIRVSLRHSKMKSKERLVFCTCAKATLLEQHGPAWSWCFPWYGQPHSCNGYNCIDDGMTEWWNGMTNNTVASLLNCL